MRRPPVPNPHRDRLAQRYGEAATEAAFHIVRHGDEDLIARVEQGTVSVAEALRELDRARGRKGT